MPIPSYVKDRLINGDSTYICIYLDRCPITVEEAQELVVLLQKNSYVSGLSMRNSNLTNAVIVALHGLPVSIQTVNFHGNNLGDECIEDLIKNFSHVANLDISHNCFTNKVGNRLIQETRQISIDVTGNQFSQDCMLKIYEKVKENKIQKETEKGLGKNPIVQSIGSLQHKNPSPTVAEVDDSDLTGFTNFPSFRSLDLSYTTFNNDDLLTLKGNSTLETLDISGTLVTDLSVLSSLSKLKHFIAYDTDINELSPLKNLSLITLEMGRAKITDLNPLSTIETLEIINLQGNSGVMHLAALSHLKRLVKLDIKGTSVDANELGHLEELPKLIELNVNPDIEFSARAVLKKISNDYQQKNSAPTLFRSSNVSNRNLPEPTIEPPQTLGANYQEEYVKK